MTLYMIYQGLLRKHSTNYIRWKNLIWKVHFLPVADTAILAL